MWVNGVREASFGNDRTYSKVEMSGKTVSLMAPASLGPGSPFRASSVIVIPIDCGLPSSLILTHDETVPLPRDFVSPETIFSQKLITGKEMNNKKVIKNLNELDIKPPTDLLLMDY
jgi:hypothetical protein